MSQTIKLKSAGSGQPLSLATGEMAINYNTRDVWVGDAIGSAVSLITGGTMSTITFDTTGLTPSTATGGAVEVGGTLNIAHGGTNGSASPTAGGVAYGNGTSYAFSSAGTSGQVLTSNGTSTPTWQNSQAGSLNYIGSTTANNSAYVAFNSSSLTGYTNYLILGYNIVCSSDDKTLKVQFSSDNGSTFYGSNKYHYAGALADTSGHSGPIGNTAAAIEMFYYGASSTYPGSIQFYMINPSANYFTGTYHTAYGQIGPNAGSDVCGYAVENTSAVNYVKFYLSAGNLTTGTFKLYGIS